jgi:hypothetical protein
MPRRDLWTTVPPVDNRTHLSATDGIVPPMRDLWRRRAVRHLAVSLVPLLVVGVVLIVVLSVRFASVVAPVRDATAQTTATVTRVGLGADASAVELRWTDSGGVQHLSSVPVPGADRVRVGSTATLRYVPSDPSRVYVGGDATYVRLRNLAYDVFLVALLLVIVIAVSVVHVVRRRRAERRPGHTTPVTYARSRRGLVHRSWLQLTEGEREWWVPVHWEPVLATTLANTPCTVHGSPLSDRVLAMELHGTPIWQSGRKRPVSPSGDVITASTPWSKAAQRRVADADAPPPPAGLGRQLRADAALLVVAPMLGLLWAYLDSGGLAGFVGSTVLLACVLLWLPSIVGTDPT